MTIPVNLEFTENASASSHLPPRDRTLSVTSQSTYATRHAQALRGTRDA